jgi:uncharacterized protein (TIGR02266 family)
MADAYKHEKRRHFRGKARAGRRVDLEYRRVDGAERDFTTGVTRNIGVGGAYILTDEPDHVGTLLEVRMTVPTSDMPIAVRAEIRWTAPALDETDTAGMGVRFLDIDVESLLKLSEYFASLTGEE